MMHSNAMLPCADEEPSQRPWKIRAIPVMTNWNQRCLMRSISELISSALVLEQRRHQRQVECPSDVDEKQNCRVACETTLLKVGLQFFRRLYGNEMMKCCCSMIKFHQRLINCVERKTKERASRISISRITKSWCSHFVLQVQSINKYYSMVGVQVQYVY
jgi:hypothetical protein